MVSFVYCAGACEKTDKEHAVMTDVPHIFSYKKHTPRVSDERWDAIVIGSGMGGLAAAALLAIYGGKKVLVLERHTTAGGYTHTFRRPGYKWDVGLHYIGQVNDPDSVVRKIFDTLTGGQLTWNPHARRVRSPDNRRTHL